MNYRKAFRFLRRCCQAGFLILFLFLFRRTDYSGEDTLEWAVNIFFRWDPLVAVTSMLAAKTFILLFLPSLVIVGLTLIFGRVFCGWICPLGTLLDTAGRVIKPVTGQRFHLRHVKYFLLVVLLVSSLYRVQLTGFLDPFALLVKGLVFAVDPALNQVITTFFDTIYISGPRWLSSMTEPVYAVLKDNLLPFKQSYFFLSLFSFTILASLFFLELLEKRFWCRNLCPLGGLLALISRASFFRRTPAGSCHHCKLCSSMCPMEAFSSEGKMMHDECTLCMDCLEYCPQALTLFRPALPRNRAAMDLNRRHLITAAITGISLPALINSDAAAQTKNTNIIRPPGALKEEDFLALCARCGECMKVCIHNSLQPLFLEKGLEGMFTPKLVPRLGYCEFNCTLCSQVCPTGAIEPMTLQEKQTFVMGTAYFDKNRCLPFAEKKPCIVCEEHCPVPNKAIKFNRVKTVDRKNRPVELKLPYIVQERCIGCGICETKCPVEGRAAVRVMAAGNATAPYSF